jgi:hypothetical protein
MHYDFAAILKLIINNNISGGNLFLDKAALIKKKKFLSVDNPNFA